MAKTCRRAATLVLLLSSCHRATGFAAWLKCYVDLSDPEEIVMNNPIKLEEDAPHSLAIQVQVIDEDNSDVDGDWTESATYKANEKTKIYAKLIVPEELARRDIQYVMETSKGAAFTSPAMCGGTRSHARQNQPVVLEVDGTENQVELLAGWATGHEAVSLTKRTVLRRDDVASEL